MSPLAVAAALLLAAGAPPFSWPEVPGVKRVLPVHGTLEARGVPVRAKEVHSAERIEVLYRYYLERFIQAKLYVPPITPAEKAAHLVVTGLDTDRLVSYTVVLRPLGRELSQGTSLLFTEANLAARRTSASDAGDLTMPDASLVTTSNVEFARTVAFNTRSDEAGVAAHYRAKLTKAGYAESAPGVFVRQHQEIRIHARAVTGKGTRVVVITRNAPGRGQDAPHPGAPSLAGAP